MHYIDLSNDLGWATFFKVLKLWHNQPLPFVLIVTPQHSILSSVPSTWPLGHLLAKMQVRPSWGFGVSLQSLLLTVLCTQMDLGISWWRTEQKNSRQERNVKVTHPKLSVTEGHTTLSMRVIQLHLIAYYPDVLLGRISPVSTNRGLASIVYSPWTS